MTKLGVVLTLSGVLGLFFDPSSAVGVILGLGLLITLVVILIVRVEKAVSTKFDGK